MQKIIIISTLFFIQAVLGQKKNNDIVFKNVNIVTLLNDQVLKNQDVAVKDGKIVSIENSKTSKLKGDKIVDLKGKYILPSLADAHVHLPDNEAEMERVLKLNLINGVTKLRSMRGDWKHIELAKKFNAVNMPYPKLYLTAPPLHRNENYTVEYLEKVVKASKENDFQFLKILSIKNENLFKQVDSLCKKYDLAIAGHFPSNPKGIIINDNTIFNSNYTSIEHLGGLVGEKEILEERLKKIKEKNIFICPTLQWYVIGYGTYSLDYMENQAGMNFIKPEIAKEWAEKTKLYREKMGKKALDEEVAFYAKELEERFAVLKRLENMGIGLLLSPDSSSMFVVPGFGMLEEMKLYKKAGLSNYSILRATSTNFATLFKENQGVIQEGKEADFIIVNANPLEDLTAVKNIEGVYINKQFLDSNFIKKTREDLIYKN